MKTYWITVKNLQYGFNSNENI